MCDHHDNMPKLTPEEGRAIWNALYGPKGPHHPDGRPRQPAAATARNTASPPLMSVGMTEEEWKSCNRWEKMPDGSHRERTDEEMRERWKALGMIA